MTTLYCQECGHKNEYSLHPPNFCGGCGIKLGGGLEKNQAREGPKRKLKRPSFMEDDDHDDDGTDIDHVPDIGKLDVNISYEGQARVFKGRDIVDMPEEDLGGRASSS